MKDRSPVIIFWIVAIIAVACLLMGIRCHAQTPAPATTTTNAAYILIHTSNGDITIPLAAAFGSLLSAIAGFAWLARILLRFLPAAKDGTASSWLVGGLKLLGATTPEKHQADVSVTTPTPNGLDPGATMDSPKTPVEVPVNQAKTPNGL